MDRLNYSAADNFFILVVIIIYLSTLIYLGFRGFRKTKSFADYVLGGRKLGPIIAAMNVGASDMSSWLLMGLPGAFYVFGLNQIWMVLGLISGSYLSWKLVAIRLRKYSEIAGDSLTLSSFLENRYSDKSRVLSIVSSLIIIFFFTIYIASGFVGSAKLFAQTFDISYLTALAISFFTIISYALLGGFLAVSWADLFQALLMLFVLLITPVFIMLQPEFPVMDFVSEIKQLAPQHLNPLHNVTFMSCLGFFAWGLGYFGQPHIVTKYTAIKDWKQIGLARKICIWWMSLSMIGASVVGILGVIFFAKQPLVEPETVFIAAAQKIFHPLIIGILISAILAAIMSTLNSQIIICCSSISEDFYRHFFHKKAKDHEMLLVSRIAVVLVAIIACVIALDENASVLQLVARAWGGLGAAIGPVILFSLFWQRTTRAGAIVGVISGAVGALIFSKLQIFSYEILPAFILSSLLIFVVSLMTSNAEIAKKVAADFKKMKSF